MRATKQSGHRNALVVFLGVPPLKPLKKEHRNPFFCKIKKNIYIYISDINCSLPQVVAFSLPGPENHLRKFRMPFTTLSKKNVADAVTFQKIFEIFKWSLGVLLGGVWPLHRHDGTAHTDATSKKKAGKPLGFRGVLCEVRCDWSALKQLFDFPMWNEKKFCWQCGVTRETYKETHLGAAWRASLVDQWGFFRQMATSGVELNPLFGCPFMNIKLFKPDWLHVCDQGITQRFVASIFWLWMSQQVGTASTKLDSLWERLQEWYGRNRSKTDC